MSNEEMKNEQIQEEEKSCTCGCNHDGHHDHDDCDCDGNCDCGHDHDHGEELPMLGIMDEEGNEHFYACLDEFEKDGKKYIITMELDLSEEDDDEGIVVNPFENDELEVYVFIDEGVEEGDRVVSVVEEDEEFNTVVEEWNKRIEAERQE